MPRYFFHLNRDGRDIPDYEGIELASSDDARRQAILDARYMMSQDLRNPHSINLDDSIRVEDEQGTALCTVTFRQALG